MPQDTVFPDLHSATTAMMKTQPRHGVTVTTTQAIPHG